MRYRYKAVWTIVFLLITASLIGCKAESVETAKVDNSKDAKDEFKPRMVIPTPFQAIVEPEFSTVEKLAGSVKLDDLVLGVTVNGESRAYPINMLTGPQREIINDSVGGQAIAATW